MAMRLTDEQWELIREPEENIPDGRSEHKPIPTRKILWHMLPQYYPNHNTVHRRFQQWGQKDVLRDVLCQLTNMQESGIIDKRESFIEATFSPDKGGGEGIGPRRSAEKA